MFFKKKKGKIQEPISTAVAQAFETFIDRNMRVFMELVEFSKKLGYEIDTARNRVEFAIGLLAPETLYAFQVFPRDKANYICDLTEYLLKTFENDSRLVYGINGAYLDITQEDIYSIYKAYEENYCDAEKEYLQGEQDAISLPINEVLFLLLAVILEYDFDKKGLSELEVFHSFCVEKIITYLDLWKVVGENIDLIWER